MTKFDTYKIIRYKDVEFYNRAMNYLNNQEPIAIFISPNLSRVVNKAILLHDQYFLKRLSGEKDYCLLLKFGFYGFRTPTLWGVLSKSYSMGYVVSTNFFDKELVITASSRSLH